MGTLESVLFLLFALSMAAVIALLRRGATSAAVENGDASEKIPILKVRPASVSRQEKSDNEGAGDIRLNWKEQFSEKIAGAGNPDRNGSLSGLVANPVVPKRAKQVILYCVSFTVFVIHNQKLRLLSNQT